jgi:hypothetical protein
MENNNENRFLEIIVNLLCKTMIPLVIILTVNSITVSVNIPMLLLLNIPLSLYMVKSMLNIKRIAENVHLFIPNNCPKPEPYSKYDIHLDNSTLTDGELRLLMEWSRGRSVRELNIHPMILNRLVKKFIRQTLTPKQHVTGSQHPSED